ncbi:hypothetical protein Pelo_8493 [Pelomyxa schiedti]|nr:hypothetical protein Pelo_8493 [Pelomyxa schiedti]
MEQIPALLSVLASSGSTSETRHRAELALQEVASTCPEFFQVLGTLIANNSEISLAAARVMSESDKGISCANSHTLITTYQSCLA